MVFNHEYTEIWRSQGTNSIRTNFYTVTWLQILLVRCQAFLTNFFFCIGLSTRCLPPRLPPKLEETWRVMRGTKTLWKTQPVQQTALLQCITFSNVLENAYMSVWIGIGTLWQAALCSFWKLLGFAPASIAEYYHSQTRARCYHSWPCYPGSFFLPFFQLTYSAYLRKEKVHP